jgi:hypothetical protein
MKRDTLRKYMALQGVLHREREKLVSRLRQIDDVLGVQMGYEAGVRRGPGRRGRGANDMTLKEAVLRVTATRAMTKEEVYQAVQKLGYKFRGKDPLNSLGVVLYGKSPRFRNDGRRFSPMSAPANNHPSGGGKVSARRKRKMSAEGRARIAAAARARWRKFRAGK